MPNKAEVQYADVDILEVDKTISPALKEHALAVAAVSVMDDWQPSKPWESIDWSFLKERD